MYNLPAANSPIRAMFDMGDLVTMLAPGNFQSLTTFSSALRAAPDTIKRLGAHSTNQIVMMANGTICLVRFGARGGHKKLWRFTK